MGKEVEMYQNQVHHHLQNLRQIKGILERITSEAGTHGVYLVDDSGFLIAEAGDIEIDRVTLSALVAASFGATAEIAKLLGETNFTQLTQQGTSRHIFICKAGNRHIVIAVFGRETNLGLVKLYVERAVVHLGAMLDYEPPSLTKVIVKGIVNEGEPEVEDTVAEPVSMEPEAETEVREDGHFESLEQFIESESELDMMPTGTAETVEDQVVDEEIATAEALVEDTSAEIDTETDMGEKDVEEEEIDVGEDVAVDEIIEEAEAVLEEEVADISDDSGGADVGEVVEEVIGEEGEEQESLTVEEESVLEDEQEEEVDPEIARLTAELRTEIAHLREESKRLESELPGQDEDDITTVGDTDEDSSPEDILGDDKEIEAGIEDVPEGIAGESDKPDEEHTEDKDKEQKDSSRMFPSWLDDE